MLEATFVRDRGHRDRVYVTRSDGTTTSWAFPSYGDGLPHDLCHLVVEEGLGLTGGFWGLVDDHVDVVLVDDHATLARDGVPLVDRPEADFTGLVQAEEAVALLASPAVLVEDTGGLAVARVGSAAAADRQDRPAVVDELIDRLGFSLPPSATPAAIAAIHERVRRLGIQWRDLPDRGSITATFGQG